MAYELMEYGAAMQTNTTSTLAPAGNMTLTAPVSSSSTPLPVVTAPNLSLNVPKGIIKPGQSRPWGHGRTWVGHNQGHSVPVQQGEQEADMVAVVVLSPRGRVLALHRSSDVKWMPGKWDLPGGKTGGVPARKAAVKILKAETGIKAKPSRLRACSAVYHPGAGTSVFYVYRIKPGESKPMIKVAEKEHQGWRFLDRAVLLKQYQTAPYVQIAFRACFRPKSLSTYTKGSRWKGGVSSANAGQTLVLDPNISKQQLANFNLSRLGGYGAFEMPDALQKEYFGLPLWGLLAAGGAAYYYYTKR